MAYSKRKLNRCWVCWLKIQRTNIFLQLWANCDTVWKLNTALDVGDGDRLPASIRASGRKLISKTGRVSKHPPSGWAKSWRIRGTCRQDAFHIYLFVRISIIPPAGNQWRRMADGTCGMKGTLNLNPHEIRSLRCCLRLGQPDGLSRDSRVIGTRRSNRSHLQWCGFIWSVWRVEVWSGWRLRLVVVQGNNKYASRWSNTNKFLGKHWNWIK